LDEFSKQDEDEFKIILLHNGAFHKVLKLVIPKNIKLVFIPPYSPELNPSEKIWWKMKRAFTGKLHKALDNVSDFITEQVKVLSKDIIKSICGFEYILSCQVWTKT
jgi:transposase